LQADIFWLVHLYCSSQELFPFSPPFGATDVENTTAKAVGRKRVSGMYVIAWIFQIADVAVIDD
jgi:hypothetical protein